MEESTDKKVGEKTEVLKQINNLNKELCFIQVANKWKEIKKKCSENRWFMDYCCEAKCINTENPVGNCIKGNGFANLIDDENIEYIDARRDDNCYGSDKSATIYAENLFTKPKDSSNYSLFYFEVKYISKIKEDQINYRKINIGLENSKNSYARLDFEIHGSKNIRFNAQNQKNRDGCLRLKNILWNNNDIFGCGLVYPPVASNNFSYIFFTHNGKQIGNPILLNKNCDGYKPYIRMQCCSVETNFGKDLKTKPFVYDFSKHKVYKYSDFEKDLNELIDMFPLIAKEGINQILLASGGIKENVERKLLNIFPKND
uniref:Uncharacterized protein n=1 Tax=Meloidogyne enterolobii TaxID=390850 RepID=A0A6V7WR46_MELEN|nr:unnamed protein product [Meloidogyne enterolobii]